MSMKIKTKGKTEFERFANTLDALLSVPHSEIKAKLDAEKKAKKMKKRFQEMTLKNVFMADLSDITLGNF